MARRLNPRLQLATWPRPWTQHTWLILLRTSSPTPTSTAHPSIAGWAGRRWVTLPSAISPSCWRRELWRAGRQRTGADRSLPRISRCTRRTLRGRNVIAWRRRLCWTGRGVATRRGQIGRINEHFARLTPACRCHYRSYRRRTVNSDMARGSSIFLPLLPCASPYLTALRVAPSHERRGYS